MKLKTRGEFLDVLLAPLPDSVVQPVISSVVQGITGRAVMRAGRRYYNDMNKNF